MEQYFVELSKRLEGYEDFEKESYAFKVGGVPVMPVKALKYTLTKAVVQHDRLGVEKRVENGGEVKTSDVAHILELL